MSNLPRGVDEELLLDLLLEIISDFCGEEQDHDDGRAEGDAAAEERLDAEVLQGLGVGVQPLQVGEEDPRRGGPARRGGGRHGGAGHGGNEDRVGQDQGLKLNNM